MYFLKTLQVIASSERERKKSLAVNNRRKDMTMVKPRWIKDEGNHDVTRALQTPNTKKRRQYRNTWHQARQEGFCEMDTVLTTTKQKTDTLDKILYHMIIEAKEVLGKGGFGYSPAPQAKSICNIYNDKSSFVCTNLNSSQSPTSK